MKFGLTLGFTGGETRVSGPLLVDQFEAVTLVESSTVPWVLLYLHWRALPWGLFNISGYFGCEDMQRPKRPSFRTEKEASLHLFTRLCPCIPLAILALVNHPLSLAHVWWLKTSKHFRFILQRRSTSSIFLCRVFWVWPWLSLPWLLPFWGFMSRYEEEGQAGEAWQIHTGTRMGIDAASWFHMVHIYWFFIGFMLHIDSLGTPWHAESSSWVRNVQLWRPAFCRNVHSFRVWWLLWLWYVMIL